MREGVQPLDQKRVILATLRQCLRRLRRLECAHCEPGRRPIPGFPCLMPAITEVRDVIRLVARRRARVSRCR